MSRRAPNPVDRGQVKPTPPPAPPKRCDHEFADSKMCVKCGWNPEDSGYGWGI